MYLNDTIRKYLDDAASNAPTPGGGSVAALAGAAGITMARMAANFTVGKKKFRDVEHQVNVILGKCAALGDELAFLIDVDVQSYAAVSEAYAMPKGTREEKKARTAAIQRALKTAMNAPLRAVRACRDALALVRELVEVANPNLISDVGVAAILTEAALRAAKINVEINLKFLRDEALVSETRAEIEAAAEQARSLARETVEKVAEAICGSA